MQVPAPARTLPHDWLEYADELAVAASDIRIAKRQWGAFHGTELDLQPRQRGVSRIVLGGISTHFGVESTARAAWEHGYALILAEDAMSAASAEQHRFAVEHIFNATRPRAPDRRDSRRAALSGREKSLTYCDRRRTPPAALPCTKSEVIGFSQLIGCRTVHLAADTRRRSRYGVRYFHNL